MNEHFSPADVLELGWFIAFDAGTIPFVRSGGLHELTGVGAGPADAARPTAGAGAAAP